MVEFNQDDWTVYLVIKGVVVSCAPNPREISVTQVLLNLIKTCLLWASRKGLKIGFNQSQQMKPLGSC